jgi:integrase
MSQISSTSGAASPYTFAIPRPTKTAEAIKSPFRMAAAANVSALDAWLAASGITEGAIFRPVDRHGRVHGGRLSGEAVSIVVRERVAAAGLDERRYSGHSLRAGLATSAAQSGVSAWRIKAQTRHASDVMLARYIRQAELFSDNPAGVLL